VATLACRPNAKSKGTQAEACATRTHPVIGPHFFDPKVGLVSGKI
jgi:hypothetical protein